MGHYIDNPGVQPLGWSRLDGRWADNLLALSPLQPAAQTFGGMANKAGEIKKPKRCCAFLAIGL
jgi:hypothetical protein